MPLRYPDIPGYEDYQPASPPPTPPQYPPEVEQWRPLVSKYFGAQDVDKALYVIQHESGGSPSVINKDAAVNGRSPGLFQITDSNAKAAGIDPTDPEQSVQWAASQVANHGWSDWGEGTNYRGVNFGALGQANPFGPGGTGRNDIGAITGGFVGAAVKAGGNPNVTITPLSRSPDFPSSPYEPDAPAAAPEDTALGSEGTLRAKLLADRGDSSAYGGIPRAALGAALNTGINAVTKVAEGYDAINPNVPYVTPAIDYGKRQVKEGVANTLTDIETAPKRIGGFLSRASLPNPSATNPLAGIESNIQQTTAPLSPEEQHLQNLNAAVAEQGLGLVPSKALDLGLAALPEVPAALREGRAVLAEAGPRIAASDLSRFLPDSILTEERAGAGIARQAGVDPLLGARARLRLAGGSMTPEEEAAARLVKLGADEKLRLDAMIGRNEENLARAARGEPPLPEPEAPAAGNASTPPPPSRGAPPEQPPPGEPPKLPPGIQYALDTKKETTLKPGGFFGEEGSPQRKIVGALNPSVDVPHEIHVANQARTAVMASEKTILAREEIPAYRRLRGLFEEEKPEYIGATNRPNAGDWTDYAENPRLYRASPELNAAKEEVRRAQLGNLERVKEQYGVDVGEFQGTDPEGVYIPHVKSHDSLDTAVQQTEASLSSRKGVTKERAYDSLNDRMARQPNFVPERDPAVLADMHSSALASMAANETFKAGAGGKTLVQVMDETHPGLRDRRDKLVSRLSAVQAKIKNAEQRALQFDAGLAPLIRQQELTLQRATPRVVALEEADKLTPELKRMKVQLSELKIRANAIDKAMAQIHGRDAANALRLRDAQSELGRLNPAVDEIRSAYNSASPGDYVMNRKTFQYHMPVHSEAIDMVTKTGFGNAAIDGAIEAGNTARAAGLGPDLSPLTIQGGLGFFSHPEIAIQQGSNMFHSLTMSNEEFAKALDPDLVRRFEFASGRRLGSLSEEVIGKTTIPFTKIEARLPGRPVKAFDDALQRVVDLGTIAAFRNDSNYLVKSAGVSREVADAESANFLSKAIPRINNADTARSVQRVKLEGFLPTSRSFTAQPFALAKDFTSGITKMATGQELLGRERLAVVRGATMLGTMMTFAVTSALLSAEANGKDPAEAVKEVVDPNSSRFMSVIVGNAGSIPIGGPFRSAFLGVYRTAVEPARNAITGEKAKGATGINAGVNYARGRLQPALGANVDVLANQDWQGRPVREGSAWHQVLQSLEHVAQAGNLTVSGTIEGARESGEQGAGIGLGTGLLGVNLSERGLTDTRNRIAMQRFGQHYDDLLPSQQETINNVGAIVDKKGPATEYAQNRDRRVQERTDAIQQKVDAWQKGQLSDKTLPESVTAIKAAFYQSLDDLRKDNTKAFEHLPDRKHQSTLDGFFAKEEKHADGEVNWDATIAQRDEYMAGLSEGERGWLQDYLGLQDSKKSQIEKDLSAYNQKREELGYFKDGLSQSQKAALDKAQPDIDVATWRYYGGQEDKKKFPDPTLNSAKAVDDALELNLPGRQIKYSGLTRPVNQDENSKRAWNESKPLLEWYNGKLIEDNWKAEAKRLAGLPSADATDKAEYAKPLSEMDAKHRGEITGNLHEAAKKSSKELDGFLYWFGGAEKPITQAGANYAQEIVKKYGSRAPK